MNIEFSTNAITDLLHWVSTDAKKASKVLKLIEEVARAPFEGKGMPEPLKYNLSGCWSRRIDKEHRLVYKVEKEKIIILACRYHY